MKAAHRGGAAAASAPVFTALGDATRLALVAKLCESGPQSITRLTAGGGVTRQAITKHLRALERAGLVHSERAGRERIWALHPERLSDAQQYLQQISEQWDHALARLRAFVETPRH